MLVADKGALTITLHTNHGSSMHCTCCWALQCLERSVLLFVFKGVRDARIQCEFNNNQQFANPQEMVYCCQAKASWVDELAGVCALDMGILEAIIDNQP